MAISLNKKSYKKFPSIFKRVRAFINYDRLGLHSIEKKINRSHNKHIYYGMALETSCSKRID